ncbi:unnamed protein product [Camellia sinensis]
MEVVSIMFYWGGKILCNRDEGVSYDIEPQGFYNVHRGITLAELQAMMVPKVGTLGEIMRLEFKCRLPCRRKYRLLPIKDNETLSNVLELPHKLGPDYFLDLMRAGPLLKMRAIGVTCTRLMFNDGLTSTKLKRMCICWYRLIGEYEVRTAPHGMGGGARQIVSLRPPSCSCGKYTLFHLPCSHMLAVTADLGEDPFPFVAPEYRLEVHKRIFVQKFRPMPHEHYWPDNDYPTLLAILARQREVKTGRPQHSCIHNEMDTSRQSGLHHCSLCLQRGHDKRKCPCL